MMCPEQCPGIKDNIFDNYIIDLVSPCPGFTHKHSCGGSCPHYEHVVRIGGEERHFCQGIRMNQKSFDWIKFVGCATCGERDETK
jgi:hypothetical protein